MKTNKKPKPRSVVKELTPALGYSDALAVADRILAESARAAPALGKPIRIIDGRPEAFVPLPIDKKDYPKKWKPGQLRRGDIVFYDGLRYWVERVPKDWLESCAVYISSDKVHPDVNRLAGNQRESFCVHADLLREAPQVKSLTSKLPTVASAERAERAKAGVRDVGDEVAVLLRACEDLEAVYVAAAKYLDTPIKALKAKYGHLNHGQQRMCAGNLMRFEWKINNGLARVKK